MTYLADQGGVNYWKLVRIVRLSRFWIAKHQMKFLDTIKMDCQSKNGY